jgi:hypothetical protein
MVWVERFLIALAMVVTALVLPPGVAFGQDSAQIVGTWRGTSVCTVPDSPCRNEENIYRFSEVPGKTRLFSCTGSKIVDGKEIVMGNSEWTFDPSKHELQTNSSTPTIRLTLNHNVLDGTLTLADGKAYRRIHLSKSQ